MRESRDRAGRTPGDPDTATTEGAARQGLATPGRALPYAAQIQAAFGRFDVSNIVAHDSDAAAASARELGAQAYASDGHVVLGHNASLHTVAHEAAHVIQQRAGIACKSDAPGDHYERHADRVADRVVAGESAEALLAEECGTGASATPARGCVQRKILFRGEELPPSWAKLAKLDTPARAAALDVMDKVRAEIGEDCNDKRLKTTWTNIAKAAKVELELDPPDDLIDELLKRYQSSTSRSIKCGKRNGVSQRLLHDLLHDHGEHVKFTGGARPKLIPTSEKSFPFDDTMSERTQSQRHLSTILFEHLGDGEEVQSSFSNDHDSMFISTNLNSINSKLGGDLQSRDRIKELSGTVALNLGLEDMSREEAMKNRTVRHALKLYQRIGQHLSKRSCILVPPSLELFDGRHAEIRIEQDPRWRSGNYNLPSGTKYPCLGCRLYFDSQGRFLGVMAGPMWLTAVSISTQIERIVPNGAKLDELDDTQIEQISQLIAKQYHDMLEHHDVELGKSLCRDGKGTFQHDPDSDSDLEGDDFDDVRNRMLDRIKPVVVKGKQVKRSRKRKRSPPPQGKPIENAPRKTQRRDEELQDQDLTVSELDETDVV